MRYLSFQINARASYGVMCSDDGLVDLGQRFEGRAATLKDLIANPALFAEAAAFATQAPDLHLSQIRFLPLISQPRTIACVGHNYEEHRVETQRDPTEHPSIFFRHPDSLQGHGEPMLCPRESTQFDYEGELAVVIGKAGRRIAEADAWNHITGVACFNEGSVRDWQHHTRQFGPGKNFPQTGCFGPFLVTLDELPADKGVELTTRVNGQVVQHAMTDQMIFPVPTQLAYVSTFIALQPGDVIVTGTPGGVGAKRKPPLWLKPGDEVEVEISSVGLLKNRVALED